VLGAPSGSGGGWMPAPPKAARSAGGARAPQPVSAMEQARKAHNEAVRVDAKVLFCHFLSTSVRKSQCLQTGQRDGAGAQGARRGCARRRKGGYFSSSGIPGKSRGRRAWHRRRARWTMRLCAQWPRCVMAQALLDDILGR